MIFIDANIYIVLFNVIQGRRLLDFLVNVQDKIFINDQIVFEVERNKLDVAAGFFAEQLLKFKNQGFQAPDHLFGLEEATVKEARGLLAKGKQGIDDAEKLYLAKADETLKAISASTDPVSKSLSQVFKNAKDASEGAFKKARDRRERGNPPGKKGDPLGDQLSWEQFLEGELPKRVWIITADGDYLTTFRKLILPNAVLQRELTAKGVSDIRCFTSLNEAMKDYLAIEKTDFKISKEEIAAIDKEWTEVAEPLLEVLEEVRNAPTVSVRRLMEEKARDKVNRMLKEANRQARIGRRR